METRCLRFLAIGVVLLGVLSGCATTAGRGDPVGLPNAGNPEYQAHPFRVVALPVHFVGNLLQYLVVEPISFLLAPVPEAVGLSLEEQRYIEQRQDAWRQYIAGERRMVQ